jgi:hypothetical protein
MSKQPIEILTALAGEKEHRLATEKRDRLRADLDAIKKQLEEEFAKPDPDPDKIHALEGRANAQAAIVANAEKTVAAALKEWIQSFKAARKYLSFALVEPHRRITDDLKEQILSLGPWKNPLTNDPSRPTRHSTREVDDLVKGWIPLAFIAEHILPDDHRLEEGDRFKWEWRKFERAARYLARIQKADIAGIQKIARELHEEIWPSE